MACCLSARYSVAQENRTAIVQKGDRMLALHKESAEKLLQQTQPHMPKLEGAKEQIKCLGLFTIDSAAHVPPAA